ncbi:hypothetical protein AVO44_19590 [Ruegeria profundi]|uniref:Uncharacterized protein n=1 Tax=Ruegeria profundi TaxID=1685378 RepID=A0A0X3TQE6_9RHOB|nr:hypothetical protein AVO44_19590 [Ruegeria profundi]
MSDHAVQINGQRAVEKHENVPKGTCWQCLNFEKILLYFHCVDQPTPHDISKIAVSQKLERSN